MQRTRAYLALLVTVVIVVCFGAPAIAFAATSGDAAAHARAAQDARAKAAAAAALAAKLKAQTAQLDHTVDALQARSDALAPQISSADARTRKLIAQVAALRTSVNVKSAAIATTQAEYSRQQTLLGERVSATYRQGTWYYLDLLFGSQNFSDLIARTELVGRVLQANSNMAAQLAGTRATLDKQKAELAHSLDEASAKRAEALAVENKLKSLRAERQGAANEQRAVLNQKSSLMAESSANAKRLLAFANAEQAESDRIEAELRRSKGSGKFHGSMAWPVPGFTRITSGFGMRMHPVLHVMRMHTGIDIGKNGSQPIAGAAIVAASSGTVIAAGYRSGYGNTVMIDHGNGVVTLYAHQPSGGIRVSTGQRVKKGQRIGTVGMSGYATGPHLHFEVRVNGTPVNPTRYL